MKYVHAVFVSLKHICSLGSTKLLIVAVAQEANVTLSSITHGVADHHTY